LPNAAFVQTRRRIAVGVERLQLNGMPTCAHGTSPGRVKGEFSHFLVQNGSCRVPKLRPLHETVLLGSHKGPGQGGSCMSGQILLPRLPLQIHYYHYLGRTHSMSLTQCKISIECIESTVACCNAKLRSRTGEGFEILRS